MNRTSRLSLSVAASSAIDAAVLALLVFVSRQHFSKQQELSVSAPVKGLIWLSQPGPGGGGGGGGNRMKEPPRRAEAPGHDAVTVPVAKPPRLDQADAKLDPNPLDQLNIPAKTLASAIDSLPGLIETPPGPPTSSPSSQGPGSGGGAGDGAGLGNGPGRGAGLGPGTGGGTGDGVYQPGNGVTMPVLLREVKPQYTSDAMRARLQGSVLLECVVRSDGSVGQVTIVRSLDSALGLDLEAIKAARQWRFRPSVRRGEPVASLVTIQLDFVLR